LYVYIMLQWFFWVAKHGGQWTRFDSTMTWALGYQEAQQWSM
jgi:hypothetical protein